MFRAGVDAQILPAARAKRGHFHQLPPRQAEIGTARAEHVRHRSAQRLDQRLRLPLIQPFLSEAPAQQLRPVPGGRGAQKGLRQRIESSQKDKVLIVLHTSTSHGPKYANKYPKEFEVYRPVAQNVEEGEKNVGRLVNAYDNTIRYTDYLLDSLITTLRSMSEWHSAMIFISDHGESLGENKMFMHGLPMKLAPKVQYEIPFLVWVSDGFRDYKPEQDLPAVLEQHYIFHSVLNLLSIQSPAYNAAYDIFKLRDAGGR